MKRCVPWIFSLLFLEACTSAREAGWVNGSNTPNRLRAITIEDFDSVGRSARAGSSEQKSLAAADSAARFNEVRLSFQRELIEAAEETRRQSQTEAARIHQAGGLQAYWTAEFERAQRTPSTDFPSPHVLPRPGSDRVAKQYRNWLSSLALCEKPAIFGVNNFHDDEQSVRVSGTFSIYGCKLGQYGGKARLFSPATGRTFDNYVTSWDDNRVSIAINRVDAILDQPGALQLQTEAGAQTNVLDVLIQPMLDVQMIGNGPGHTDIQIDCADSTNLDGCVTLYKDPAFTQLEHSIGAYHLSECCFNSVSDRDRFTLDLKNGWTLKYVGYPFNLSGVNCNPPYAGLPGKVGVPSGYTIGAASTTFEVSWWADANCSYVKYALDIYITGPIGVSYR